MKIKEIVEQWQKELRELKGQVINLKTSSDLYSNNVKLLTKKVDSLIKISESMAETIMALVSQQLGD